MLHVAEKEQMSDPGDYSSAKLLRCGKLEAKYIKSIMMSLKVHFQTNLLLSSICDKLKIFVLT